VVTPSRTPSSNHHNQNAAIISFQDIYAYDSARALAVADQLAADTGCSVVHVDFTSDNAFTGEGDLKAWVLERSYDTFIKPKLVHTVVPYIQQTLGATKIAAVGFCWGSYLALSASADIPLVATVQFHPSLKLHGFFDESDPECNTVAEKAASTPHLLVAAGNDPEFVGPDGSVMKILQAKNPKSRGVVLKAMSHGFVNRGDVSDPAVKEGVKSALEMAAAFLNIHLKESK